MFKKAVKDNIEYIKPIIHGYKYPNEEKVYNNMNTVMIVNEEGWVLTCKHVAENIVIADKIMARYEKVKKELFENKIPPKKIFKRYDINDKDILILRNVFLNLIDKWDGLSIIAHKTLDMCLIKFDNPKGMKCKKFPVFAKANPSQGETLCRLGYPYQGIECFTYSHTIKDLIIDSGFESFFQVFPIDGMMTRHLIDEERNISLFEMTNPALIGQSGGPIVNKHGYVVGLQVGTGSKDLGFTINTKIDRDNKEIDVKEYPFMHFGIGINVETIKAFMDENNVKYDVEK